MSKKTGDKRRTFIERMFGKKAGDELAEALEGLQRALNNAGVDHKELDTGKAKAVLEDLAEQIDALLTGITDNPPEELRNQIIALVMGAVADSGMVDAAPEPDMETMAEDEEDDEDMAEQMLQLSSEVKSLARESTAVYEEIQEFIPAFISVAKAIKDLTPLVKAAGRVDDLDTRIIALEKSMRQRPRAASQAEETTIENVSLLAAVKKGTEGQKTVLGIPVKE